MNPEQIIEQSLVPGTHTVLVLGCYEQRVTVYSQQVRALNLVDAILSKGLVREGGKVAIVGAGAAGITAAVALARSGITLKLLDVFETRSDSLELQRGSTRYLHPHLYDWPDNAATDADAGLPLMSWTAGLANDVSTKLRAEFEQARQTTILSFIPDVQVTGLVPSKTTCVRVLTAGNSQTKIYDVVILAIGFGLERHLQGETHSYWTPSVLAASILLPNENPTLFISGNGDGGLVDFQMAALNGLDHRQVCELLMKLPLGEATAELEAIEQEAWAPGASTDLYEQYRTRVKTRIPVAAWGIVIDDLRKNVRIHLHTREKHLLERKTALHNRLLTFMIIEADRDTHSNAIQVTVNAEFEGNTVPVAGAVHISSMAEFTPQLRFLRLGPDKDSNFKPFDDVLASYASRVPSSALRPQSPKLTASARLRFKTAGQAKAAFPSSATSLSAQQLRQNVIVTAQNDGIAWFSQSAIPKVGELWRGGVSAYLNMSPSEGHRIAPVIARILFHTYEPMLYVRDAGAWRRTLDALCSSRTQPSPTISTKIAVLEIGDIPDNSGSTVVSVDTFCNQCGVALDKDVLSQLNDALYDTLGPAKVEMGWPIQSGLATKLWERWLEWKALLENNDQCIVRFLALLVTERDSSVIAESMRVRIGPRSVRPCMLNSTLFGLAFAVCGGRVLIPATRSPGNVFSTSMTGHICGIEWIDGRTIGPDAVSKYAWNTTLVLLSQLKEALGLVEGEIRFDRPLEGAPRVGALSPLERPVIIGADEAFVVALELGEAAVYQYFRTIFDRRAALAQATLEEKSEDV